jgi:hypothetical protein
MKKRLIRRAAIAAAVLAAAVQLYRPDRTNPAYDEAGTFEAMLEPWPEAVEVLRRACYDCHSNETVWPWYSQIAPFSWVIADDVRHGRSHLNFSEWGKLEPARAYANLLDVCEIVINEEMPLPMYVRLHPEAALSSPDIDELCALSALAE